MKNRKRSKISISLMILLIQFVLMGAGWFTVGLRNTDSKDRLVNIDALIGGTGMPSKIKTPKTKTIPVETTAEAKVTETSPKKEEDAESVKSELEVRVKERKIFINQQLVSEAEFETQFMELYDESKKTLLIDDYADYQTYVNILKFFGEKKIEIKEELAGK